MLQYVRAQGCEWDGSTTIAAAYMGQLPCLIWAVEQGCDFEVSGCLEVTECEEVRAWIRGYAAGQGEDQGEGEAADQGEAAGAGGLGREEEGRGVERDGDVVRVGGSG